MVISSHLFYMCHIHELPSSQQIGDDPRQGVDYFNNNNNNNNNNTCIYIRAQNQRRPNYEKW